MVTKFNSSRRDKNIHRTPDNGDIRKFIFPKDKPNGRIFQAKNLMILLLPLVF